MGTDEHRQGDHHRPAQQPEERGVCPTALRTAQIEGNDHRADARTGEKSALSGLYDHQDGRCRRPDFWCSLDHCRDAAPRAANHQMCARNHLRERCDASCHQAGAIWRGRHSRDGRCGRNTDARREPVGADCRQHGEDCPFGGRI